MKSATCLLNSEDDVSAQGGFHCITDGTTTTTTTAFLSLSFQKIVAQLDVRISGLSCGVMFQLLLFFFCGESLGTWFFNIIFYLWLARTVSLRKHGGQLTIKWEREREKKVKRCRRRRRPDRDYHLRPSRVMMFISIFFFQYYTSNYQLMMSLNRTTWDDERIRNRER